MATETLLGGLCRWAGEGSTETRAGGLPASQPATLQPSKGGSKDPFSPLVAPARPATCSNLPLVPEGPPARQTCNLQPFFREVGVSDNQRGFFKSLHPSPEFRPRKGGLQRPPSSPSLQPPLPSLPSPLSLSRSLVLSFSRSLVLSFSRSLPLFPEVAPQNMPSN